MTHTSNFLKFQIYQRTTNAGFLKNTRIKEWPIPVISKNLRINGRFHEITSKEPQFSGAVLWLFFDFFFKNGGYVSHPIL
jgi:hypothetical protein